MKNNIFNNKVILVTGGVGSIGSHIVKTLLKYNPKQIRVFDIRETELVDMQRELINHNNLSFLLGDIRDKERLNFAMKKVDMVFHAAALKHVPACEYNPFEAVKTNVYGTQNMIDAAINNNVGRVVNISTDKAADASTLYGTTKQLGERLTSWAGAHIQSSKFASVRLGNVMETRGNVFEIWKEESENNQPLSIMY